MWYLGHLPKCRTAKEKRPAKDRASGEASPRSRKLRLVGGGRPGRKLHRRFGENGRGSVDAALLLILSLPVAAEGTGAGANGTTDQSARNRRTGQQTDTCTARGADGATGQGALLLTGHARTAGRRRQDRHEGQSSNQPFHVLAPVNFEGHPGVPHASRNDRAPERFADSDDFLVTNRRTEAFVTAGTAGRRPEPGPHRPAAAARNRPAAAARSRPAEGHNRPAVEARSNS